MSKNFKYTHKLYAYENCAKVEFKSPRQWHRNLLYITLLTTERLKVNFYWGVFRIIMSD